MSKRNNCPRLEKKRYLIKALVLAVTAPTDKACLNAVKLADTIAATLKQYEIKYCKREAAKVLNYLGLKAP